VNRRLLRVAVACALLGSFITFSIEYANRAPTPHNAAGFRQGVDRRWNM
jgi:hypothetical protein